MLVCCFDFGVFGLSVGLAYLFGLWVGLLWNPLEYVLLFVGAFAVMFVFVFYRLLVHCRLTSWCLSDCLISASFCDCLFAGTVLRLFC